MIIQLAKKKQQQKQYQHLKTGCHHQPINVANNFEEVQDGTETLNISIIDQ